MLKYELAGRRSVIKLTKPYCGANTDLLTIITHNSSVKDNIMTHLHYHSKEEELTLLAVTFRSLFCFIPYGVIP